MNTTDAIEAAVRAASLPGLLEALRPLAAPQRHEQRAAVLALQAALENAPVTHGMARTHAQWQVLYAALALCGTPKDLARSFLDDDLLVALGREFAPRALDGLAEVLLEHSPQRIRTVQALIAAGLAPRPDSPAYALGLIALPWVLRDAAKLDAALAADPGLPAALLRVFEVEGTSDTSLASSDKYNHAPGLMWGTILLGLVDRGVTTRAELLDRTLTALENDWPQYRSGWFSRFHAELAPDIAAMRPHLARYLSLCHSRIPPTVGLALDAVNRLDAAAPIDADRLADALRPALAGAVKSQVEAALKLLDRLVQREPGQRGTAASLVVPALLLESAPLQKAILKRLAAWGVDDAARAALRGVGTAIAAVNRPAWQALAGEGSEVAVEVPQVRVPENTGPLAPARAIAPVAGVDELVECIAHAFENDTDVDAFERAVAGIVALAPFDVAALAALSPVRKRAAAVRKPMARALARLLLGVAEGRELAVAPGVDSGGNASPVQAVLLRRIDALIGFAGQGGGAVPLAAPTHRRGFIAPAMLVERVAAHRALGRHSAPCEQVLALLRLAPGAGESERAAARRLPDDAFVRALRHALGDRVEPLPSDEFFAAAARIRHPRADDAAVLRVQGDGGPDAARAARYTWRVHSRESVHEDRTYRFHDLVVETAAVPPDAPLDRLAVLRHPPGGDARHHYRWWTFGGIDDGAVCWSATLLPSCLDAFFAEGARSIGSNLDWWEAQWHNAAYLRLLLDPTAEPGETGTLLLALGLLGKEPGQTAIAVDALVQAATDGRLDAGRLGDALARLFATPLPKAARLRASLAAALRANAALREPVFDVLAAVVTAEPVPREVTALLELLLELKLQLRRPLPERTREVLAGRAATGRAKALAKDLIA